MSALGELAAGAVSGGIWKATTAAALAALVYAGAGWGLASRDRDQAKAELKAEQGVSEGLRGSIREQGRAVTALAEAKRQADARGALAQQLAAANGRRFDGALQQLAGARAATCAEAMPTVNQLLEAIR